MKPLLKFVFRIWLCTLFILNSESRFVLAEAKPVSDTSFSAVASDAKITHAPMSQAEAFSCDFDDNIFYSIAKIYVWNQKLNREVAVSTKNWAIVKNLLGKPGRWKNFATTATSFREFNDRGPEGVETFVKQIERTLKETPNAFKAPSWNAFAAAMQSAKTRDATYIITAREHSPQSILKGLLLLKERGLIPDVPPVENLFPVGWSGFGAAFQKLSIPERKAQIMMTVLDKIQATPVPADAREITNREGNGLAKLHLWGFSDDDFDNYSKALDILSPEVAKGRWPSIKISLFFTGTNNRNEKQRSIVLSPNGTPRTSQEQESTFMEKHRTKNSPPERLPMGDLGSLVYECQSH